MENTTNVIMQRMFSSLETNYRTAICENEKVYMQVIMYLNSVEKFSTLVEDEQIVLVAIQFSKSIIILQTDQQRIPTLPTIINHLIPLP